jgi:hypothetical protein
MGKDRGVRNQDSSLSLTVWIISYMANRVLPAQHSLYAVGNISSHKFHSTDSPFSEPFLLTHSPKSKSCLTLNSYVTLAK